MHCSCVVKVYTDVPKEEVNSVPIGRDNEAGPVGWFTTDRDRIADDAVRDLGMYPSDSACDTTDDRNCAEPRKDSLIAMLATSPLM